MNESKPASAAQISQLSHAVNEMADSFLRWPLPLTVCTCLSTTVAGRSGRTGTELLTETEARQMFNEVAVPVLLKLNLSAEPLKELKEPGSPAEGTEAILKQFGVYSHELERALERHWLGVIREAKIKTLYSTREALSTEVARLAARINAFTP